MPVIGGFYYFILCLVCGYVGGQRRIGGFSSFFLCLFLTPFIGMVLVLNSKRLEDVERDKRLDEVLKRMG
jgi:hypothetical protein